MITEAFMKWFEYFQFDIDNFPNNDDNWHFFHRIDTQNKPEKFKRLLTGYIKMTIHPAANNGISIKYNSDISLRHPFHKNNAGKDGYADPNIFLEDIKITTETVTPQLFLPDFFGNTFFRAFKTNEEKYLSLAKNLGQRRMKAMKFRPNNKYILKVISFDDKKVRVNKKLEDFLISTKQ